MEEQKIIKEALLKIFNLHGYTDFARMTQRDFEHISGEIEKKAGIIISSTTIKRLSNGEFSRLPQIATLNAIANYFGYSNWQEFKASEQFLSKETPVHKEAVNVKAPQRSLSRLMLALSIVAILAVVFFIMGRKKTDFGDLTKVIFTAKKNTDNKIPNTVVFSYNIDNLNADSFFIQQSWDKNRRVRIYKNHYTLTDIYYEPGYHIAKLIANDSIIREVEVSIPTDKWFFFANENKDNYKTEYIKVESPALNGKLGISKNILLQNNIDISKDMSYIYAYFPSKQEVAGDNFTLKTRVRMMEVKNNLCPFLELEIYCQRNYMIIKSTEKGCASEALLQFGNKVLFGKETDLGNISFDIKEWNDVDLLVKNKNVTVKINGKAVYKTTYETSAKNIAGLAFISNGLCEVDRVDLTGNDGVVVYSNDFDKAGIDNTTAGKIE
jgi:transcriptional regulator with XRE-family HTH domain